MRKTEKEIKEILGDKVNNTLNHLMKDKDTTSVIFPTSGLWKGDILFQTTNNANKPSMLMDPDLNKLHHIKMNQYKRFDEEMQKAKNMMKKTNDKKDDKKK